MGDVFISYSKTRRAEAKALVDELGELGFDVWWDTSLLPTGSFEAEINRQLDAAKAVIVMWSPQSVQSLWVKSEASHGLRQSKLVSTHTADLDPAVGLPWGSAQANYHGNYVYAGDGSKGAWRKGTVPVASFAANLWGLYQVHGNVWEWCEDAWHDSYEQDGMKAPTDGSAWTKAGDTSRRRVLRGSSWGGVPRRLRAANRHRVTTDFRFNGSGFRLGMTL